MNDCVFIKISNEDGIVKNKGRSSAPLVDKTNFANYNSSAIQDLIIKSLDAKEIAIRKSEKKIERKIVPFIIVLLLSIIFIYF